MCAHNPELGRPKWERWEVKAILSYTVISKDPASKHTPQGDKQQAGRSLLRDHPRSSIPLQNEVS